MGTSSRTFFCPFALLLATLASAPLSAQIGPGMVLHHKKISEAQSVFPGGLDPDDQMGRAVISPGDINGDGRDNLVSGAVGDDDGGTQGIGSDTGALWVHFLGVHGQVLSNVKISATSGNLGVDLDTRDQFGRALCELGDFDGDGVPDIGVGSCRDDDGGVNRGAVYLLFLQPDGSVKETRKISDTAGGFDGVLEDLDEFGRSVANLGDLDGNGVVDLAVGAIGDDDGGVDQKGALWILFLAADGSVDHEQKISDTAGNFQGTLGGGDLFGFAAANLGDIDGNGVIDIAVGTPKDDDGGVKKGAVWILFMKTDGTVKGHKKISDLADGYGLFPGDEFGSAVAGIGDLDGDGVRDLAIGAILDDGGLDDQGAVWINFLRADGTVRAKQKINDVSGNFFGNLGNGDWFGSALGAINDLDGDGKRELAVGARFDDDGGLDTGSVWILFLEGAANVPPTPNFVAYGVQGVAPRQVSFQDKSSAGADLWDWDFGDGATSTLQSPTHTYTQPGIYSVSLTVSGPGGTSTLVKDDLVQVLVTASATMRNGSGVNRVCFQSTSLPVPGTIWSSQVDAIPHAGATMTMLLATSAPHSGLFLNAGELLVKTPGLGGSQYYRSLAAPIAGVAHHSLAVPNDPALAGAAAYVQAVILGGSLELGNAVDIVVGY